MKKHQLRFNIPQLCLIIFVLLFNTVAGYAQTTITTNYTTGGVANLGGSAGGVFAISNTNAYGIIITDISHYVNSGNSSVWRLWYNPTEPLTGAPSSITTANGWIQANLGQSVTSPSTGSGIIPLISGLSVVIPANTTWRFALESTNGYSYRDAAAAPNLFSADGVELWVANNTGSPGYTGTFPNLTSNSPRGFIGSITFIPAGSCTMPPIPGSATVTPSSGLCIGSQIILGLSGNSGGGGQSYQWQSSLNTSGPWTDIDIPKITPSYTTTATATLYYRAKIKCGQDSAYSNPVLVTVPPAFPGGAYTINASQPTGSGNFASFSDAISAVSCGVAGPVVFNVATGSGPYNEQINIPALVGVSAANSIRFNGNGETVQYNASGSNQGVLMMDGAKYITFDSITFKSLNATYGSGAILYNGCDRDSFTRCTFDLTSVTATSLANSGIRISATSSGTSNTISGATNTYIGRSRIWGYAGGNSGIYYGIYAYGPNNNNVYEHNLISNTYQYATYIYYGSGNFIHANKITRETKTGTSNCYGLVTSNLTGGSQVTNNRIEYLGGATNNGSYCYPLQMNSTAGTASAPVLVANNIVGNMTSVPLNGGIYINGGSYIDVYHNTVSIDLPLTYSSTTNQSGISSSSTTANIKNNIVSYKGGGPNTKFGLYLGSAPISCNYNNIYMSSVVTGTQYYGYRGSNYATFPAFQGATAYEANGYAVDPLYASISTGDFTPTNALIDNAGSLVGINTDINGIVRNAITPDLGAIEFSVSGCVGTPVGGTASVVGNITHACVGGTVLLSASGFSIGSGINIQWEESPSGVGSWLPISGATGPAYTATIAASTDYRLVVTCVNGGSFDYSNTISITVNPFYLCYCSPNTGVTLHGTTNNYIAAVDIPTTTLNIASTPMGLGGYTQHDFTITANTASIVQGQAYAINVAQSGTYGVEMWIDWNQSGIFDTSEYYLLTATNPATASFTVPVSAVPGFTGMRLRSYVTTAHSKHGACSNIASGRETEDFVINIIPVAQCAGVPSMPGAIGANDSSVCNGSSVTLSLYNHPIDLGLAFQWESSPSGQNNFIPIAGATGLNYTTGLLSADVDYRMAVTCTNVGGGTAYTNVLTITVDNPQLVSVTGATRCGVGTVTLNAVAAQGNSINWYATAMGGAPIGTGASFTTPLITNTTTYYAAASSGASNITTGLATPTSVAGGSTNWGMGTTNHGIVFDVYAPFLLQTVTIYPVSASNASGTVTIDVINSSGTIVHTATVNVTGNSSGMVPQVVTLNFNMQPGTNYKIRPGSFTGISQLTFNSSPGSSFNYNYPIVVPGVMSINTSTTTAAPTNTARNDLYYYFYDWQIAASCEGSKVPVVATVIPSPTYTIIASPDTICLGSSSTVSIGSSNNYTYTWTPSGTGASFTAAPSTTTKYYVNGIDGNNCAIYDSVVVAVKSAPANVTVSASPDAICMAGSTTLTLTPTPMYGIGIEWEKNTGSGFVTIPGANNTMYTELVSATTTYRAKLYCNNMLATTSSEDTVNYKNPQIAQTYPGSRCGTGPVTLAAVGAGGAKVKWYNVPTGGNSVGNGNAYTTPSISATTTYYAEPISGLGGNDSVAVPLANGTSLSVYFHMFMMSTTTGMTLNTIGIKCNAAVNTATSWDIYYRPDNYQLVPGANTSSTGWVLLSSVTNVPSQGANAYTTIASNLGLVIPPNSTYSFHIAPVGGATHQYAINTVGTVTATNTHASIIAGHRGNLFSCTTSGGQAVVSMGYSLGCTGPRVPVTATINPAASGTGLATGGTTVGTNQAANTTESYTDACNDTVAIVASGSTALGTTSAIVLTSATVPTHQNKPFVPRAYDINPATDGPATVTLYALQSEFNAYNSYVTSNSLSLPLSPTGPSDLTGMGNIVITQYHGSASAGTQGPLGLYSSANVDFIQNSSITVTPVGNYWKLTFPVTGFSGFFIHTGANPLAIDLKNISAVNMGSRNRVDWTTGREQSGDRFELERSADGTNFRKLADITAKGQPSGYSYWDETPVTGVNYYRLKLVDASGKGTYSKVVTATVKSGNFTVEAYPNPVKDVLTVKVFGVQGKDATVSITDITGKVIRIETMSSDKTTIEMSGLAQGMYLIKYTDSDHSQTIKVNKM